MTVDRLITFERRVAAAYDAGLIRAPVHLSGGNERQLAEYFATYYRPGDWVFGTWRSHYHALLAGVPEEELMEAILAGKSIALCFPEHRFLTSAIVGGHLSIAVGVAMAIAREPKSWLITRSDGIVEPWHGNTYAEVHATFCHLHGRGPASVEDNPPQSHVHAFLGDMAAEGGAFHECRRYAVGHDLPITFVVEDNGLSVLTDTQLAWGPLGRSTGTGSERGVVRKDDRTVRYTYDLAAHWPHAGAGKRITF